MFNYIKSLFSDDTPVINFACANWGVRKYAPIQPAGKFFPEKFKEMSPYYEKGKHNIDHHKTVRACPGITDYMSMGFVIPAFCDIEITPTPDGKFVETRYSEPTYNDAFHPEEQLGNFLSEKFPVRGAVKLDNPWFTWNKVGYSTLYLPMYYHEGKNWEAVPGVMDHDTGAPQSPINIMLKEIKPTMIKMGEPLVQVIPVKRESQVAKTFELNETAIKRHQAVSSLHNITYAGWIKWVKQKKYYTVDAHDTDLPGDQ